MFDATRQLFYKATTYKVNRDATSRDRISVFAGHCTSPLEGGRHCLRDERDEAIGDAEAIERATQQQHFKQDLMEKIDDYQQKYCQSRFSIRGNLCW